MLLLLELQESAKEAAIKLDRVVGEEVTHEGPLFCRPRLNVGRLWPQ